MIKLFKIILSIILLAFISACGFEGLYSLENSSIRISKISASGDKRIGHIIKNEISLISKKYGKRDLEISIDLTKKKEVKEKNISNNVTKYNIILYADLTINEFEKSKVSKLKIQKSSDYAVSTSHSDTIENEKKAVKSVTELIAEDIVKHLILNYGRK